MSGQKYGTDDLDKNLVKWNGVLNVLEVWGDLQSSAEAPPFNQAVASFLKAVVKKPWVIAC